MTCLFAPSLIRQELDTETWLSGSFYSDHAVIQTKTVMLITFVIVKNRALFGDSADLLNHFIEQHDGILVVLVWPIAIVELADQLKQIEVDCHRSQELLINFQIGAEMIVFLDMLALNCAVISFQFDRCRDMTLAKLTKRKFSL